MNTKEIELILDGKSQQSTTGQIWSVTKFLTGLLWCSSKFVVKNTPAAIGMAWEIKKELSSVITEEIHAIRKEQKKLALEKKLLELERPKRGR